MTDTSDANNLELQQLSENNVDSPLEDDSSPPQQQDGATVNNEPFENYDHALKIEEEVITDPNYNVSAVYTEDKLKSAPSAVDLLMSGPYNDEIQGSTQNTESQQNDIKTDTETVNEPFESYDHALKIEEEPRTDPNYNVSTIYTSDKLKSAPSAVDLLMSGPYNDEKQENKNNDSYTAHINTENNKEEEKEDEEWSQEMGKIDYYSYEDVKEEKEDEDEKKEEEKIINIDDDEYKQRKPIDLKVIIDTMSICISFLLAKHSPLWGKGANHHSTKDLVETKKKIYKFKDRCSIFRSDYVLGKKEKKRAFLDDIKDLGDKDQDKKTAVDILTELLKYLDKEKIQYKQKWDKLVVYWDSWEDNKNINMEEYKDLEYYDWENKYGEQIKAVKNETDRLIEQLKTLSKEHHVDDSKKRLQELKNVNKRKQMKQWLKKWKTDDDNLDDTDITYSTKMMDGSTKLFKSIMGYDLDSDQDLKLTVAMSNLPMKHWTWEHVVHWIQKIDEFKHFGSIFCEWKINGDELLVMNEEQIALLASCCYRPERLTHAVVKDLLIEVRKNMISTTITYQYGVWFAEIRQRSKNSSSQYHVECDRICELLDSLRPKKEQGPKALWKLDAFYVSKVDNILSILVAPNGCRELFRHWFPKFIFEDNEIHANVLEIQNRERKASEALLKQSSTESKSKKVVFKQDTDNKTEQLKLGEKQQYEEKVNSAEKDDEIPTAKRYVDCIDTIASPNCCKNSVGDFIRNFDRTYLKVMCLFILTLSFGCLVVWYWMSTRSREEIDIAMKWTSQSIVDRAIQYMEYEFFIPQMVLNIAIGGLYSDDITINPSDYLENPQFDSFFTQYSYYKASQTTIYSLCMYETQNNTIICSTRQQKQNGYDYEYGIYLYNGSCGVGYPYNAETKQRDTSQLLIWDTCGIENYTDSAPFIPSSRPWYKKAKKLNVDDIGWTDPYVFAWDEQIGISLVRKVMVNGVEVLFLAEFTTNELDAIFEYIGSVKGGVTYLIVSNGSAIASNIGEVDLNPSVTSCPDPIECSAINKALNESIAFIRKQNNDRYNYSIYEANNFVVTLHSFSTTYLSGNNIEYGTIAVVYGDEYLSQIENAEILALAVFIFSLSLVLSILCFMSCYIQCLQREIKSKLDPSGRHLNSQKSVDIDELTEHYGRASLIRAGTIQKRKTEAKQEELNYLRSKYDGYLVDSNLVMDHKTLRKCPFWYLLVIFIITFFIWNGNIDSTLDDATETFLSEEYMIVQDQVVNVLHIAHSIADIVEERFDRGDMDNLKNTDEIHPDLDAFFANIMNSFRHENGDFYAHMLYIGTPDGKFVGSRRETSDDNKQIYGNTLRIAVRDKSTDWAYRHFAADTDTLQRKNTSNPIFETDLYDPRCRGWFKSSISYMFSNNIWKAFGDVVYDVNNSNFLNFYHDEKTARESTNCIDVVPIYMDIWNVTKGEINNINNANIGSVSLRNNTVYESLNGTKYDIIWSQYLFASGSLGLTASKPIIGSNGELLAVMAIDFTLEGLSDYLQSTNNENIGENEWYTWMFTGDGITNEMIASSDHQITAPLTEIEGCIQAVGTSGSDLVQYDATVHPNYIIRVLSQEIVRFYPSMYGDVDNKDDNVLPINTTTEGPQFINLPIDLPDALSGRFLTYPFINDSSQVSLNWIIVKSIDINNFETKEQDDVKIIGFLFIVILFAVLSIQSSFTISTVKIDKYNSLKSLKQEQDEIVAHSTSSTNVSRRNTQDLGTNAQHKENTDRAQDKYRELLYAMVEMVEGSSAEIWDIFLKSYSAKIGDYPISTAVVRDFMAKESNKHIARDDKNDNLTLRLCALQRENKWFAFKILEFFKSYGWNTFITTIIFFHLGLSVYMPDTPQLLKEFDFGSTTKSIGTISGVTIFIIIEIIDVIYEVITRYIFFSVIKNEFRIQLIKLKYGFDHHYVSQVQKKKLLWLIFFGTEWRLFVARMTLVLLILFNFIMMISVKIAIFEYYIPLVPILLVIRSEDIREFSLQFFYAVYLAKDVLFSYFILIVIVAILALSVFSEILNPYNSTDTFNSSIRALITSFVFISTGENYNEIVYSAINANQESDTLDYTNDIWWVNIQNTVSMINLILFVFISIVGLYFFVPVMIHKFEFAFKSSQTAINNKHLKIRINSIIAAFIMLDMNDDGEISEDEFQYLVHSSIISRDVLFDAFANAAGTADNDENKISLFEFTSTLTNQTNSHFNVAINGIPTNNTKYQAFLECNWYRRTKNRYYLLIYILVPSLCIAILRGLTGIDPTFLNIIVHIFFILNFIDINLRWFTFGRRRYFNLIKYQNPTYIQQAIYNWRIDRGIISVNNEEDEDGDFSHHAIQLSYDEKKWCSKYLRSVKPLNSWDKMTVSTIHKFEICLIWIGTAGILSTFILPSSLSGYYYLFIQIYLFRLFTLIQRNQRLIVLIFTIIPHFVNLLAFLFMFIFIWSRIGCTIFANTTDYVLDDIYSTSSNASFDTLGSSILTLMQLMVGEGWHEIMYLNMIATRVEYSFYFILYIIIVTLIISNIFVGLFLSEIEDLDNKQSESKLINQWMESHYNFNHIANKRKMKLMQKLKKIDTVRNETVKQIEKIEKLLLNKARKKKSKWNVLQREENDDDDDDDDDNDDNDNDDNDNDDNDGDEEEEDNQHRPSYIISTK